MYPVTQINEVRQQRAAKIAEQRKLNDKALAEKRNFTADEQTQYVIQAPVGTYQLDSPFWALEDAQPVPGRFPLVVHDHGREVGRGFSNDLDQTERATTLTQSNFSLQFVQGRVVISHRYPYVPHRQLMTAS